MRKLLFSLFPLLTSVLVLARFFVPHVQAADGPTFINFIYPVRGEEGWEHTKQDPIDLPNFVYQESTPSAAPLSWALRFDAVNSATISAFFNSLTATDSSQLLAAFLEVTPKMTLAAQVEYPPGDYLLQPQRVFLSGYSQKDRLKLIDTYMASFWDKFGRYPASVIAWHIDSYSLEYLRNKYSVTSAVIVDDQYSMDHYRVWGSYWGSPYYPSRLNVLVPASSKKDRVDLVVSKWAARDPFNGFDSSLYSFQINDFPFLGLDMDYFERLLALYSQKQFNEFSQVNIGIENDYSLQGYKQSISQVFQLLKENSEKYNLRLSSLPDFASWYFSRYPQGSAPFAYFATDPSQKTQDKVLLYQNSNYRIVIKQDGSKTYITDFRLFNSKEAESFYLTRNIAKTLFLETQPLIDSLKYPDSKLELDFDLNSADFSNNYWDAILVSGGKTLRLEPERIIFDSISAPILKTDQLVIKTKDSQTIWIPSPSIPFSSPLPDNLKKILFVSLIFLLLLGILRFRSLPVYLALLKAKSWLGPLLLTFFSGAIALLTVIRSGLSYPFGMGFWGPNGHDAIFHLSIIASFRNSLTSFSHPQLAGLSIKNYHIGFDYLTALLSRIFALPVLDLYFRLLPAIFVGLIGCLVYRLLRAWKFPPLAINLSLLGIFLTGSLGFILSLFRDGRIFAGESLFWANQAVSIFLNPPLALSFVFLLLFLYLFEKEQKSLSLKKLILLSLIGGLLVQLKVYAFLLLLAGLLFVRQWKLLAGVGLAGFLFVLPTFEPGNAPFIFAPLWFVKSMVSAHDRLNWERLAQAWQVYEVSGLWLKLLIVNLLALAIFFVGNLGIRLLGLIEILISKNKYKLASQKIVIGIIFVGLAVPLLFIQKANPWNTIQFSYYSLFFLIFFTATTISRWHQRLKNPFVLTLLYLLVALLTLPTTIGSLRDYVTAQSAARLSFTELYALKALKEQPPGIVLSPLYESQKSKSLPTPKPLYGYISTAYVSAFSGKTEYLSDTINLDITNFDYTQRARRLQRFFNTQDTAWARQFLADNNISYVYQTPLVSLNFDTSKACMSKIFDSGEITVYKFSCHD